MKVLHFLAYALLSALALDITSADGSHSRRQKEKKMRIISQLMAIPGVIAAGEYAFRGDRY